MWLSLFIVSRMCVEMMLLFSNKDVPRVSKRPKTVALGYWPIPNPDPCRALLAVC
jgi:hypothetical protein